MWWPATTKPRKKLVTSNRPEEVYINLLDADSSLTPYKAIKTEKKHGKKKLQQVS